jgi:hypothetical protein
MAELSTTAVAITTATGVGVASLFPDIDGNALIGAFAGATLFVMSAREFNTWSRIVYMLISSVMGYIAAPEVVAWTFIHESGVAAFVAGCLCVTVMLGLIKQLEGTNLISAIREFRK